MSLSVDYNRLADLVAARIYGAHGRQARRDRPGGVFSG